MLRERISHLPPVTLFQGVGLGLDFTSSFCGFIVIVVMAVIAVIRPQLFRMKKICEGTEMFTCFLHVLLGLGLSKGGNLVELGVDTRVLEAVKVDTFAVHHTV